MYSITSPRIGSASLSLVLINVYPSIFKSTGKNVNITGSSAKTNGGFYETLSRSSRGFYDDDEE